MDANLTRAVETMAEPTNSPATVPGKDLNEPGMAEVEMNARRTAGCTTHTNGNSPAFTDEDIGSKIRRCHGKERREINKITSIHR